MELYYIWLECVKGLGPLSWHAILEEFANPYDAYVNRKELIPQGRITKKQVRLIRENAEDALERTEQILFYYKGRIPDNWTMGAGIVGARRCTHQSKEVAINITSELVKKKHPIISELAKGIDSYAHTAAIYQGGFTVAVLGFGIDHCYPMEHKKLKDTISEKGLLISEYPPGTPASKFRFPRRNRIIAGLSDVLYVIGAKENSGTRTTIQAARTYKKEIVRYS